MRTVVRIVELAGPEVADDGAGADGADVARLDDFRDLSRADRRPDRPGGRGLVLAEGTVVVRRLLDSPYPPRALLGVPRRIEELGPELAGLDVPAFVADAPTMAAVVGFHLNRGVLASADRAPAPVLDDLLARARRVAVLEAVNDHENLGALFRNAAALGVDAVLLAPGCADPLYRRSVRVSMGHVFGVGFAVLDQPWPASLDRLREAGVRLLAMTPRGSATALASVVPPSRWALLLGAEGPGLSEQALAAADEWVRIPMADGVDSLNVATAGAVALAHLTG
jgi:tRNA G18 (ribose-2'-O)-methylase SpoU